MSNRATPAVSVNRRWFTPVMAFLFLLSGCTSSSVSPLPKPPSVSAKPTTTTLPDYSNVSLARVNGTTTTVAAAFRGGSASISGKVTLNGGPAGGATVRVERFDGDQPSGTLDVTSDPNGSYSVSSIHGGRYRMRAFRTPDAGMPQAQVFFLGADEKKRTDLGMQTYSGGTVINASINPDPPILGTLSTLTVSVSSRGVDGAGVARSIPQAGLRISVNAAGGRAIVSANPSSTGSNGRASFTVLCTALDRQGVSVTVEGSAPATMSVAQCELPPTTTTTTESVTTTSSPPTTVRNPPGRRF